MIAQYRAKRLPVTSITRTVEATPLSKRQEEKCYSLKAPVVIRTCTETDNAGREIMKFNNDFPCPFFHSRIPTGGGTKARATSRRLISN